MDALSDVLNLMRLKSCVYFLRDFASPWGMEMPSGTYAQFHMVTRGRCWLRFRGELSELAGGDVVVFARGGGHVLVSDPDAVTVPGMQVLEAHVDQRPMFSDGAERVRLLCGHFEFDRLLRHPLVDELPDLIHVQGMSSDQPDWLDAVTRVLIRATGGEQPGDAIVVDRLAEVLFIQVLRAYLVAHQPLGGFLGAIRDMQISRALRAIHAGFASELTLADIARQAGMSRSNLALRFKGVLGETPMDYVTRWRMLKAQELLKDPDRSLSDVAECVGYKSESAFSHTFKRQFGRSPGVFRRTVATDR